VFFDIGSLEFLALIVVAILLFGPDKLPKMIQDVARFIRKVREYSDNAKRDIRAELGPEFKDFEFEDLNPKRFAKKHLLDGDELGLRELRDSLDVRKELTEVTDAVNGRPALSAPGAPGAADLLDVPDAADLPDIPAAGGPADLDKSGPADLDKSGPADLSKSRPADLAKGPAPAAEGKARLAKDGDTPAAAGPPFDVDAT
jgi:sec-independent protein translocase protein TatB